MKTNTLDFDAQALREKILDLAMRGKLVPQDSNDKPASVLLKKIKAEKEQLIKEKKIKKSKSLAPITDDEKPFDIPDSWEWVRFGDVGLLKNGKTPKKEDISSDNIYPYFKVKDMNNNNLYMENAKNWVGEKYSRQVMPKNTIIFPKNGGAILTAKKRILTQDSLVDLNTGGLIPYNDLNHKFIFYLFLSLDIKDFVKGSAVPTINSKKLKETLVPLPPLEEQSRIAAKIAQLFALLRKVESSTQQYAKLQTLLKSKVLDLAMRGKLVEQDPHDEPASVLLEKIKAEKEQLVKEGKIKKSKQLPPITDDEKPFDIPDSWEWVRLGDILKPEVHKKPVKDFYYIDIASIDNQYNKVVNPKKVIVKKDKIASRARQVLENDDILFSVVRPYLRNIAMVPKDNNYKIGATGFYVLKPYELINRKYIFCLTLSNYTVTNMTQKMRGDNSPSIRKSDMQNLIIPIPPRMEQDKIVNMIIRIYSAINLN